MRERPQPGARRLLFALVAAQALSRMLRLQHVLMRPFYLYGLGWRLIVCVVACRWTGIPVTKLTMNDRERVLKLGERLKARVIGQDTAVKLVADAILRSRAGIAREQQPQGSFLFLGARVRVCPCPPA